MMGNITNVVLLFCFIPFFYFSHAQNAPVNSSWDSRCIESEWKALMEFKASVFGTNNYLSSWTGRDCCSWNGVTCHSLTGHVRRLELGRYDNGEYGRDKYGLDEVSERCQVYSPLSPWVFNLSHLEVLSMGNCWLLGSIPNMFEKLTSLTTLDLSSNSFDFGIFPYSLCGLKNLTHIILGDSHLQGSLPLCLGNLTSLTFFDVAYNKLSGEIPGWLDNFTHLNYLSLYGNHFNSSIPFSFGNLQQLEYLYLSNNQLSDTIPPTLGNLTKLISLDVRNNSLVGELSESVLKGLKSLGDLDISANHHLFLNVSPQWIPKFNITYLCMDSVFIGTQFPTWLQTQSNFETLKMVNTSIFGAIPDWHLTAFPYLTHFDLSRNAMNGFISDQRLSAYRNVKYIDLSHNCLTGNIPTNLCHLKSLVVTLSNNQFTGVIPSFLGTLSELLALHVGNNSLSGHIPNELGLLKKLCYLHLNGKNFFGELPSSLQNLTSLITHDLGGNQLQGSIPQWIGKNLSNLEYLRLESNKFSGEIPVNLCQLPFLHILNLALNNLIGTIPPCFGSLKMIQSSSSGIFNDALLNIIKGREMEYTSTLQYAKFISLSGNHLHGEIPAELMNLKGLQSLNLSNNELSGNIPETINNLKQLESLDSSMNRLFGTIPQSLESIDALSYPNLSFNNFTGKVPSGNHFNTLDNPSIYEGNVELCGKLLMKSCIDDASPNGPVSDVDADKVFEFSWLYSGIGPGFAVGFLGVIFILYFKDSWRIAYFGFADNVYNQVRVTFTIKFSQFRSKFN